MPDLYCNSLGGQLHCQVRETTGREWLPRIEAQRQLDRTMEDSFISQLW